MMCVFKKFHSRVWCYLDLHVVDINVMMFVSMDHPCRLSIVELALWSDVGSSAGLCSCS